MKGEIYSLSASHCKQSLHNFLFGFKCLRNRHGTHGDNRNSHAFVDTEILIFGVTLWTEMIPRFDLVVLKPLLNLYINIIKTARKSVVFIRNHQSS